MAVFRDKEKQKIEFSKFNISCKQSGSLEEIVRNFGISCRCVYLSNDEDGKLKVEKDGIIKVPQKYATNEEIGMVISTLGVWFDRANNDDIVNEDYQEEK